jgi:hypothetical protein
MYGTIAAGVGVSWAGFLGGAGIGVETWFCVSMLSALVGVRWAVGRWERGKKRWWQDWDRVCAGLDRDLKVCTELNCPFVDS